jgi:hypothetical protein
MSGGDLNWLTNSLNKKYSSTCQEWLKFNYIGELSKDWLTRHNWVPACICSLVAATGKRRVVKERKILLCRGRSIPGFQSLVFTVSGAWNFCGRHISQFSCCIFELWACSLCLRHCALESKKLHAVCALRFESYFPRTAVQKFAIFLQPSSLSARSPFPHNAIFAVKEAHYASAHGVPYIHLAPRNINRMQKSEWQVARAVSLWSARRPGF